MTDLLETVYEHERGRDTFTVTAAEPWSIAMIHKLKAKYPEQVDIRHVNPDGSMVAHLPFEWMRIVPKRKDTLSDEERAARSERMKSFRRNAGNWENGSISKDSTQGGVSALEEASE